MNFEDGTYRHNNLLLTALFMAAIAGKWTSLD